MKASAQLPRDALFWLIGSQLLMLLPLLLYLPPWILAVALAASLWRFQVYQGRWSYPARWARALLAVAAAVAVLVSFRSLLGLEPMVALLLVASSLKLLEAKSSRDGYVLAILGFFICLNIFLFDQSIPSAIYVLLCVALLLSALIALNQNPNAQAGKRPLGVSVGLVAQALPLMVLPFLFFPRIAPLWSVPIKRHGAETGMSDTLRPGDVARLGQNDAVAFRAQFAGDIPPLSALYWRGLTLGSFDDGTWRQHRARSMPNYGRLEAPPATVGEPLAYRIIQAPTQQRWLYGLRYAEPQNPGAIAISDFRFVAPAAVEFEMGYRVISWPGTPLEVDLPEWRRRLETEYPARRDARTRALVASWLSDNPDPVAVVERALRWFREQPFYYTLEPPPIADRDFVDAFLFESRRGFCEHYAYSFTAMMRQAGIPARIVAGYQGGEINPVNGTVVVRQLDAHAWSEVWLEGQGWVRVDPTGAVSPERIELGISEALRDDASFLANSPMSALRYRDIGVINWLRMRYDAMAWQWQSLVVGFGGDTQIEVLKRLLGEITPSRMVLFTLGGALLILGPGTWWLFRPQPGERPPPAERDFQRLCRRLERRGIKRLRGEAPRTFVERVKTGLPEREARQIESEFALIEAKLYEPART
jgi:transglutaminase-like putative cysteine protease